MTRKIQLNDTPLSATLLISVGNIGAAKALATCSMLAEEIDPQCMLGAFGMLGQLESMEIYGADVWLLFKVVCGERPPAFHAVLRAVQLGLLRGETVKKAIRGELKLKVDLVWERVCERLTSFQKRV